LLDAGLVLSWAIIDGMEQLSQTKYKKRIETEKMEFIIASSLFEFFGELFEWLL